MLDDLVCGKAWLMQSKVVQDLRKAIAAIESAIAAIEKSPDQGEVVGVCIRDQVVVYKPGRIVRGLCPKCYSLLKSRVDAGETTWAKLEAQGNARPKGKTGRKKMDL